MTTPEHNSLNQPFPEIHAEGEIPTVEMSKYSGFELSDEDKRKVVKREPNPVDPRTQAKLNNIINGYFSKISPEAFTELFNATTRVYGQIIKDPMNSSQAKEEAIIALKVYLGRSRDSFFTQSEIAFILTLATGKYTVDVSNFSHPEKESSAGQNSAKR